MVRQTGKPVHTPGPIERLLSNGHQAPSQPTLQPSSKPLKKRFQWTGFSGKTLWNWLELFGAIAIPLTVVFVSIWYSHDLQIAHDQQQQTTASNMDQQRQTTYDTYLDRMSDLITTQKLQNSKPYDEIRALARARTIATLQVLDPLRKGHLLVFLHEAQLLQAPNPIIDLRGAELRGAELRGAELRGAELRGADLRGADLSDDDLRDDDLFGAHLSGAYLIGANLRGADLGYTDLSGADLTGADLTGADLRGADLRGAFLFGADLTGADLTGADLTNQQLQSAYSLQDTIMPDGSKHP